MTRWLMLVLAAGCVDDVRITGVVGASFEDPSPLAGATYTLTDGAGAVLDEGVTAADGRFAVTAPAHSYAFLEVAGPDGVPATFTTQTGRPGGLTTEDGRVYGVAAAEAEAFLAPFSACDRFDAGGGTVFGEIRAANLSGAPVWPTGFVWVEDGDDRVPGCYLNLEGTEADPSWEVAGPTGRFAVFGLAPGVYTLVVGHRISNESSEVYRFPIAVSDGGVVSLRPAWIEVPL